MFNVGDGFQGLGFKLLDLQKEGVLEASHPSGATIETSSCCIESKRVNCGTGRDWFLENGYKNSLTTWMKANQPTLPKAKFGSILWR